MTKSALRRLYLSTMIRILANTVYQDKGMQPGAPKDYDPTKRASGLDWPSEALTMIGTRRLENLCQLTELVIKNNVAGDMIETGVWRGGACILMRAVLASYGDRRRSVICADSFVGLPPPDEEHFPSDKGDRHHTIAELAISRQSVEDAFKRFDLLDEQVIFLEGFFRDTLPSVAGRQFSLLRLDGDMYESTIVAMETLYPRLNPGGYIIIDDFGAVRSCRQAVEDYRKHHGIREPIQNIDWTGVWWQKNP